MRRVLHAAHGAELAERLDPRSPSWLLLFELATLSGLVLTIDYFTGPFLRLAVLLLLPVSVATYRGGLRWGLGLAVLMPLVRLSFVAWWGIGWLFLPELASTLVLTLTLAVWAVGLWRILRWRGWILAPGGVLAWCADCHRVHDREGRWRPLASYVSAQTGVQMSRATCPDCSGVIPPPPRQP